MNYHGFYNHIATENLYQHVLKWSFYQPSLVRVVQFMHFPRARLQQFHRFVCFIAFCNVKMGVANERWQP